MNQSFDDPSTIQALYSKYCFALDGNNPDLLLECFAPGAIFQVGDRQFQGEEQLATIARSGDGRPRHHYSNLWVKNVEGDKAVASAYFFLLDLPDGSCAGYGEYDDDMVCDPNRVWRFQHRRVKFMWQSDKYKARTNSVTK